MFGRRKVESTHSASSNGAQGGEKKGLALLENVQGLSSRLLVQTQLDLPSQPQ